MSLSIDASEDNDPAMTVSRSFDGGASWEPTPKILKRDTLLTVLHVKNSMTADRGDAKSAYAIWDHDGGGRSPRATSTGRSTTAERRVPTASSSVTTRASASARAPMSSAVFGKATGTFAEPASDIEEADGQDLD